MAKNFNLSVDEDDIEELLEKVPERLMNCWNWIRNAELNKRQKKRKLKEEKPKKKTHGNSVKGLAKAYADLKRILKCLKT